MNRHEDFNTEIELDLPQQDDSTVMTITGTVVSSRNYDQPDDIWTEDLRVMFEDGNDVPQDMVDLQGRNVWDVAEDHALFP